MRPHTETNNSSLLLLTALLILCPTPPHPANASPLPASSLPDLEHELDSLLHHQPPPPDRNTPKCHEEDTPHQHLPSSKGNEETLLNALHELENVRKKGEPSSNPVQVRPVPESDGLPTDSGIGDVFHREISVREFPLQNAAGGSQGEIPSPRLKDNELDEEGQEHELRELQVVEVHSEKDHHGQLKPVGTLGGEEEEEDPQNGSEEKAYDLNLAYEEEKAYDEFKNASEEETDENASEEETAEEETDENASEEETEDDLQNASEVQTINVEIASKEETDDPQNASEEEETEDPQNVSEEETDNLQTASEEEKTDGLLKASPPDGVEQDESEAAARELDGLLFPATVEGLRIVDQADDDHDDQDDDDNDDADSSMTDDDDGGIEISYTEAEEPVGQEEKRGRTVGQGEKGRLLPVRVIQLNETLYLNVTADDHQPKFQPVPMPDKFEDYDLNSDGRISLMELRYVSKATEGVQEAFQDADSDGDGLVDRDEFKTAGWGVQVEISDP